MKTLKVMSEAQFLAGEDARSVFQPPRTGEGARRFRSGVGLGRQEWPWTWAVRLAPL